ncbi:Transporter, major facilitator family domain containing protein, related, partial [Eimeria maxima]
MAHPASNQAALQQQLLQQQLLQQQHQQPYARTDRYRPLSSMGSGYQQVLQQPPNSDLGSHGFSGGDTHANGAAPFVAHQSSGVGASVAFGSDHDDGGSAAYRRNRRKATLKMVLVSVILVSFLCNFDHGVIPAILSEIQKNFNNQIKFVEQSLFGSLVYFGLIIGSLFAGIALQSYGAKWLLVASLLCLESSLFFFSSSNSLLLMYFMRFITGLCQAVPVVYLPVWVDDYAPEGEVTRWMSYTQLAGIGGEQRNPDLCCEAEQLKHEEVFMRTVTGYFIGGVFSRLTAPSGESGWRTPFFVQSVALAPVVLLLAALPASLVNLSDRSQARPERQ